MNDFDYRPGDPGNTPNGEWVRETIRRKGVKIDRFEMIRRAPEAVIYVMFNNILKGGVSS